MSLHKITELSQDYRDRYFEGHNITQFDVYALEQDEQKKVGQVKDLLIDDEGRFRYFIIDTGFWVFGKSVLLPVGRAQLDYGTQRLYAQQLSKAQVEALPEYTDGQAIDEPYEDLVYNSYRRAGGSRSATVEQSLPVESTGTVEMESAQTAPAHQHPYQRDPQLYSTPENDHLIRLYEERIVAEKQRENIGEVTISKQVETESQAVSIPVMREKVIVEINPSAVETTTQTGTSDFQETEVSHVTLQGDVATAHKEVGLRKTASIRKEVDQSDETFQGQVRREVLDVDASDDSRVEQHDHSK